MATEKTTIIPPLTIRQTETWSRTVQGLADLRGMEKCEYIRHLVADDEAKQKQIWEARNRLFASQEAAATSTQHDKVGHES